MNSDQDTRSRGMHGARSGPRRGPDGTASRHPPMGGKNHPARVLRGQVTKVPHLPELRFALGEPAVDTATLTNASTVLAALSFVRRSVGADEALKTIERWTVDQGRSYRPYPGALVWCAKKRRQELRSKLEDLPTRQRVAREVAEGVLELKYGFEIPSLDEERAKEILDMDDCLSDVLLFSYSGRHGLGRTRRRLRQRVKQLQEHSPEQQDRFWLLLYEVSTPQSLRQTGQGFLADLKDRGLRFLRFE